METNKNGTMWHVSNAVITEILGIAEQEGSLEPSVFFALLSLSPVGERKFLSTLHCEFHVVVNQEIASLLRPGTRGKIYFEFSSPQVEGSEE